MHDLIKSVRKTNSMLQDRMALSKMESQQRRLFDDLYRSEVPLPSSDVRGGDSGGRASFVRCPPRRGVRVSARFKKFSPIKENVSPPAGREPEVELTTPPRIMLPLRNPPARE